MKFRLLEPWPIKGGAMLVPPGTVLDTDEWSFNGVPLPKALPITAMPLDYQSHIEMRKWHPEHLIQRPHGSDYAIDEMIERRLAR